MHPKEAKIRAIITRAREVATEAGEMSEGDAGRMLLMASYMAFASWLERDIDERAKDKLRPEFLYEFVEKTFIDDLEHRNGVRICLLLEALDA